MDLQVTALYAALLALVFLVLCVRVITYRREHRLGLGDHGDRELVRRMRAQANCAEYAPIGLFLLALTEAQGAPGLVVHALGAMLLMGRAAHAWGFSQKPMNMRLRVGGMALTLTMIGATALGLLGHALV